MRPDYSFEREGLGLSEWLWRLVDRDRRTREAAGKALQSMQIGLSSVEMDWGNLLEYQDAEAQRSRFEVAVRSVVNAPDFDTREFIQRLCAYRLALAADWRLRAKEWLNSERTARYDRLAKRVLDSWKNAGSTEDKESAEKRLIRLTMAYLCDDRDQDSKIVSEAESVSPAAIAAGMIFSILGPELLAAQESLALMLDDQQLRHDALQAFARIGPAAIAFAPRLIAEIDSLPEASGNRSGRYDGAEALGRIGRGKADVVEAMIERLTHDNPHVRHAAASVLQYMETDICGRERRIIDLLREMLGHDAHYSIIMALASIGRHLPEVRKIILARAADRPPRMISHPDYIGYGYDQTMVERGIAISAMRYLVDYPDECVPVLIEAMESFEEYDPDESYGGPHARIARVLTAFGPKAAAAALPLARHLQDEPGELPRGILDALAAIGPAAKDALPLLETLRPKFAYDEPLANLDAVKVSKFDDPIGWTIQQIRGK